MVSYTSTRIRVVKLLPFDIVPKLQAKKSRGKLCNGTTRTRDDSKIDLVGFNNHNNNEYLF